MANSRMSYDECAYGTKLSQSVSPLNYVLDRSAYEHKDKCFHQKGLVGSPAVSHIKGDLVDLESDLMGYTRPSTLCDNLKYSKTPVGGKIQPKEYMKFADMPTIDTTPLHLQSCQMIDYRGVPNSKYAAWDQSCEKK